MMISCVCVCICTYVFTHAYTISLPLSVSQCTYTTAHLQHLTFEHIDELHLVLEPGDKFHLLLYQLLLLRLRCVHLFARCGHTHTKRHGHTLRRHVSVGGLGLV